MPPDVEVRQSGLQLLGAATVGAGVCFVLIKGHGHLVRSVRSALAYWRNPLRHQTVQICNTFEECQAAVRTLNAYDIAIHPLDFTHHPH